MLYIYLIIFLCIIGIIYLLYRRFRKNTIEHFDEPQYQFLKPLEAYHIIEENGYFDHFNKINIRARLCANVTDCKNKYRKELMLVDPMEEDAIKWLIDNMVQKIKYEKPRLAKLINIKLRFAKFSAKLEDNMPHTHSDIILLPASMYNKIWQLHQQSLNNDNKINYAIQKYGSTIIHELAHILQRKYPYFFNSFYESKWNFKHIQPSEIKKNENIFERARLNPDGIDMGWIWVNPYSKKYKRKQEYYLLMATFKQDHPKYLSDVNENVYILTIPNGETKYQSIGMELIKDNGPLQHFFGDINNNYHPNEIAAEYMSHYIMELMKLPSIFEKIKNKNGYVNFIDFIERLI